MTPTPLLRHTPFLMPSPLRANTSATWSAEGSAMAMPVGTSRRSPAASVIASSIQAHRSMHAAPAVANRGSGISVPIFSDSALIFSSILPPFSSENEYKS